MFNWSREYLRYRIERYLEKRGARSIVAAFCITLVFILVVMVGIRYIVNYFFPEGYLENKSLLFHLYHVFIELTDPGNMAHFREHGLLMKITAVLTGLIGIVMFSFLIAIITTELDQQIKSLQRGKSKVFASKHILILGWNSRIFDILTELNLSADHQIQKVVLLSEHSKEFMDTEVNWRLPQHCRDRLDITSRSGKTTLPAMLDKVNICRARSILVLASCEEYDSDAEKIFSDAATVKTCFAISIVCHPPKMPHVIPELFSPENRKVVQSVLGAQALYFDSNSMLSRMIVQTTLSNGLASIYSELFSFDKSEFYRITGAWPRMRFGHMFMHFQRGIPVGLYSQTRGILLNPSPDEMIEAEDELLIIGEDRRSLHFAEEPLITPQVLRYVDFQQELEPVQIQILGWSAKCEEMITEFDKYIPSGSEITVTLVQQNFMVEDLLEHLRSQLRHAQLTLNYYNLLKEEDLRRTDVFSRDILIVMPLHPHESNEKIDSDTIKLLLLLKELDQELEYRRTTIVTEVLNTENAELFQHIGINDFIVSNRLISSLLTQLSVQPSMLPVFEDLLSNEGSEIYIKPIRTYIADPDIECSFADLMLATQRIEDILIGLKKFIGPAENPKQHDRYEVIIDPPKSQRFRMHPRDEFIVLAEEVV